MKTSLPIVVVGLLFEGCLQFSISGNSLDTTAGRGSSTGSATAGASTGGSSGSSTGSASSSSTSSSSTGTSGSPPACSETASNLQDTLGYPSLSPLTLSNSADFNGDGLLDVIVASNQGGTLSLLLGSADGDLTSAGPFLQAGCSINGPIVAADVNGDGLPDLVCVENNGIHVLLNVGGKLTIDQPLIAVAPDVGALAVGDLNQDGIPDIVEVETALDSDVKAFIGLRDGGFSAPIHLATLPVVGQYESPARLFLADLNQDGFPDIGAVAYSGSQLELLVHKPDGGYLNSYYTFPGPIVAAPVPRSAAAPDIVVGYDAEVGAPTFGVLQLLVNAGDGTFSMGPSYDTPNSIDELVVSDFNGDCLLDVASSADDDCFQPGGGISVIFGTPDGGFDSLQMLRLQGLGTLATVGPVSNPRALAVCDPCVGDAGSVIVFGDASRH